MAYGEKVPLTFFNRFTTLAGSGTKFFSNPVDFTGFSQSYITIWRGNLVGGTSPTFNVTVQFSADLDEWSDDGANTGIDPGANSSVSRGFFPDRRYVRLYVDVTGDAVVTMWATGWAERTTQ